MTARAAHASSALCAGILFLLLAAGCNTTKTYRVEVDAINDPSGVNGWSYILSPQVPPRLASDPLYPQMVMAIHDALSKRGLYQAPRPDDAVFVVSFDFGERAPQTKVTTVNQPVFVQPGIAPMGTIGGAGPSIGGTIGTGGPTIGVGAGGTGLGSYPGNGYPGSGYPGAAYPGASGRSSVVMVPTTRVTRTSEKYLVISARENAMLTGGRPPREVWRVEAVLEDEEADVSASIPALVDAVIEYVGTNTGGPVRVVVKL